MQSQPLETVAGMLDEMEKTGVICVTRRVKWDRVGKEGVEGMTRFGIAPA
jgi:hypothetical protein